MKMDGYTPFTIAIVSRGSSMGNPIPESHMGFGNLKIPYPMGLKIEIPWDFFGFFIAILMKIKGKNNE